MLSFPKAAILISVLSMLSCSPASKNDNIVLKSLNAGLANSNIAITRQSEMAYHNLESKMSDPFTHHKAEIWYPKAIQTQKSSSDIFVYIQRLKEDLLKENGFYKDHLSFNEDDKKSVKKLFITEKKGEELSQKLNLYKSNTMKIDPIIAQEFHNHSLVSNASENAVDKENSMKVLFDNTSVIGALAVLTQLQNSVKLFENRVASFCNEQVTNNAFIIDIQPSPIIVQSSKYLKTNDELEINAGLGKFKTRNNLRVLINNKEVAVNDYGYSELKLKIKSGPGTYNIPVRLEYNDQDANKRVVERIIKYTVIE